MFRYGFARREPWYIPLHYNTFFACCKGIWRISFWKKEKREETRQKEKTHFLFLVTVRRKVDRRERTRSLSLICAPCLRCLHEKNGRRNVAPLRHLERSVAESKPKHSAGRPNGGVGADLVENILTAPCEIRLHATQAVALRASTPLRSAQNDAGVGYTKSRGLFSQPSAKVLALP